MDNLIRSQASRPEHIPIQDPGSVPKAPGVQRVEGSYLKFCLGFTLGKKGVALLSNSFDGDFGASVRLMALFR